MKVLSIHNTIPEYRVAFFRELSKLVDLEIMMTEHELAFDIYSLNVKFPKDLSVVYMVNKGKMINKLLMSKKYDLVVLPPIDNFYQMQYAFRVLAVCYKRKMKTVYWTEKWEQERRLQPVKKRLKNWLPSKAIRYFAHRVDRCVAAGRKLKLYYIELGIPAEKISVAVDSSTSIPCPSVADIRSQYRIPDGGKVILFLGRLVKRKGCEILMEAFRQIVSECGDTYLLICGDGEEKERLATIAAGNERIVFVGKVEQDKRAAYYRQSYVFVLPSFSFGGVIEAWGLTVNEALEQGTPVVTTSAVGAAYDLADGKCCLMVEENDAHALANGILSVLSKGGMAKECMKHYEAYSVRNMAECFYDTFSIVLNMKGCMR